MYLTSHVTDYLGANKWEVDDVADSVHSDFVKFSQVKNSPISTEFVNYFVSKNTFFFHWNKTASSLLKIPQMSENAEIFLCER